MIDACWGWLKDWVLFPVLILRHLKGCMASLMALEQEMVRLREEVAALRLGTPAVPPPPEPLLCDCGHWSPQSSLNLSTGCRLCRVCAEELRALSERSA